MKHLLGFLLALTVIVTGCASKELEEERAMGASASGAEADLAPMPTADNETYGDHFQSDASETAEPVKKASKKSKKAKHKKNKNLSKKNMKKTH